MKNKSIIGATCACLAVVSFNANTALIGALPATPGGTDFQAYYDTDAKLTWLADADVNGSINWADATAWAAGLTVDGIGGWRLPDTLQPDASCDSQDSGNNISFSYNCTGSELGNLYYNVLSNTASPPPIGNPGPFSNVVAGGHWTATEYSPDTASAWAFDMGTGLTAKGAKTNNGHAWAVQSGDVGGVVPVPAAVWLFGSGLIGLVAVARRKA